VAYAAPLLLWEDARCQGRFCKRNPPLTSMHEGIVHGISHLEVSSKPGDAQIQNTQKEKSRETHEFKLRSHHRIRLAAAFREERLVPKVSSKNLNQEGTLTVKPKGLAVSLGVAVLMCMSTAFAQTYNFQTINYPDDTFTQLLGINDSNEIAGYHGASINKGFTYDLSSNTFTSENYPKSQQTQVTAINSNDAFKTAGFYILHGKTIGFTDLTGTFTSVAFPKKPLTPAV
jgi:hypothetical protein